ncbi:MAG TPA: CocE/NonD family hydrolase, partial [Candidatus Thermoplasmatota archaeon]|nr:CocE/NonD family hydrolase [Candidatus Thermoplasmatota archaeon]
PGQCASNAMTCIPRGDDPSFTNRIDAVRLAQAGYAVVISNVRGTGNSGGCFSMGGLDEQLDQVALVETLAAAEWSNGRVGMIGHSYPSFTAWMGAVHAPPALKTVVVSGLMTDLYLAYHTPQGAASADGGRFQAAYSASIGLVPPLGAGPAHALVEHAPVLPERLCPEAAQAMLETQRGGLVDDRDAAYWEERRLSSSFENVNASVLVVSGFEDAYMLFHAFQDDDVWNAIRAPKRAILGHWGHVLPPPSDSTRGSPFGPDWYDDTLLPWLDHWLKGVGDARGVGSVVYEAAPGVWRESTSWPPAEAREEVLYLADGSLSASAGGADARLLPVPTGALAGCAPGALVFLTEPQDAPFTVAGNAYAHLRVTSDRPGGIVSLDLYDVGPDGFRCGSPLEAPARWLAGGAADLRFHDGRMRGADFPTGTPTSVRVDIHNQAWTVEPGRQLALVVSVDGWMTRLGQPYAPTLTLGGGTDAEASHLVLPLVEGTLGGAAPTLAYPPKPFAPTPAR